MRLRRLFALTALGAAAISAPAAAGGIGVTIVLGHGGEHGPAPAPPVPAGPRPMVVVNPAPDPVPDPTPAPHGHRHHGRRPLLIVGERAPDPAPAPPPAQAAKASPVPPEPPAPPDPRGPLTHPVAAAPALEIGRPVPPGRALVTVTDWRRYGLEPPPDGQRYARFGRELVLVTVLDRRVAEIVADTPSAAPDSD